MAQIRNKSYRSRFNLPAVFCRIILASSGWKISRPDIRPPKFILIGAPHTSNWDFVIGYMAMTAAGLRLNWIGKHTLFKPPLGWFLKWLGGIPVNRSVSSNFVDQVITFFREREQLIVAISPEGTRKHTDHWKSGFYYIALGARVPLILGFVDYGRRIAGVGKLVELSGETERDLEEIRSFYANITPRYPENFGEIAMRKRSERSAPDG